MDNQKDILTRLNRCCALLGVVTCDLTRSGANTDALEAVRDLLSGICADCSGHHCGHAHESDFYILHFQLFIHSILHKNTGLYGILHKLVLQCRHQFFLSDTQ